MSDLLCLSGTGRLLKDGVVLFNPVEALTSVTARGRGLLGRPTLPDGHAVLLAPCRAIHTWFMCFRLDVAFLDANLVVTRLCRGVKTFRMAWGPRNACATLEWRAGWLPAAALAEGDRLVWQNAGPA
jgi:hypothetical protein